MTLHYQPETDSLYIELNAQPNDQHRFEIFLQLEGITHSEPRSSRPLSNGVVERLHHTLLDEHFHVAGRKA